MCIEYNINDSYWLHYSFFFMSQPDFIVIEEIIAVPVSYTV